MQIILFATEQIQDSEMRMSLLVRVNDITPVSLTTQRTRFLVFQHFKNIVRHWTTRLFLTPRGLMNCMNCMVFRRTVLECKEKRGIKTSKKPQQHVFVLCTHIIILELINEQNRE